MTNEQLALLLDPRREKPGWWDWHGQHYGSKRVKIALYTGPDYHASDDACFRDWRPVLLEAGCKIKDSSFHGVEVYLGDAWIGMMDRWTKHTYRAAVLAAIEELQTTKPELLREAIARVEGGANG